MSKPIAERKDGRAELEHSLRLRAKQVDLAQHIVDDKYDHDLVNDKLQYVVEYDSFDDFLADVKLGQDESSERFEEYDYSHGRSYDTRDGWYQSDVMDVKGRAHQLEIVRRGYTTESILDFYESQKSKLNANPDDLEKLGSIGVDCRRKKRADLGGYIVNIDKAMSGLDPMESYKRNNQSQCVRFFIDLARLGDVPCESIIEACTLAIACASALEERGYATEIKYGTTNLSYASGRIRRALGVDKNDPRDEAFHRLSWIAKHPDEPLNVTKLLTFSSASIFRDLIFQFRESVLEQGIGASGYTVVDPEEQEEFFRQFTDCDIYVGNSDNLNTIITNISGVLS